MTDRVGVVVVSHSAALADAVVALARQMVDDDPPPIAVAAGTDDGGLGTDAMAVLAAVEEVSSPAGVIVLMDLGSAVLSTETALEFLDDPPGPIRLVAAPIVEGTVAAVVQAALGSDLDTVVGEATRALDAKRDHLGEARDGGGPDPDDATDDGQAPGDAGEDPDARDEVVVVNRDGIHARPAAALVRATAGHDARITLADLADPGREVRADSLSAVAGLDARAGTRLAVSGYGPAAADAVADVVALVRDGFGEPLDQSTGHGDGAGHDDGEAAPGQGEADDAPWPDWAPRVADPVVVLAPGRAVGPAFRVGPVHPPATPAEGVPDGVDPGAVDGGDVDDRVARLLEAAATVADDLDERAEAAPDRATGDVLAATAMLARDPDLLDAATRLVRDGVAPAAAVQRATEAVAETFRRAGGRLAGRQRDVEDVGDRVVAVLAGRDGPTVFEHEEPWVLVADDLAPVDAASVDPATCLGLVLRTGTSTSHTAVIARARGLPAIAVGDRVDEVTDGAIVLLDADAARFTIDPDEDVTAPGTGRTAPDLDHPGRTADGHPVALLANVGGRDDVTAAVEVGAEGVGLLRTELLFLGRTSPPSVDEQAATYRDLFAPLGERRVVVRTLDAGSDKPLPFVTDADEPNPALGVRGIRTTRAHPQLLDAQLRAVARAADQVAADVEVMAPLVSTVTEAEVFAAAAASHGLVAGVMVETPAAALAAGSMLDHVSFLSLGTNDLAQYALAADRLVGRLADLTDPWQPAVLDLVAMTAAAAGDRGRPVGVCGEAAGDPALAVVLVGLGATSLSMVPRAVPLVAAALERVSLDQARNLAAAARYATTAAEARSTVRDRLADLPAT